MSSGYGRCAATDEREHPEGNAVEPGQGLVPCRYLVDSPPSDQEDVGDGVRHLRTGVRRAQYA